MSKKAKRDILLHNVLHDYVDWTNSTRHLGRDIAPRSIQAYRHCLNNYGTYLGRQPTVADLRPEIMNAWLAHMLAIGMSPRTVNHRRIHVGTIWRYCNRVKLTSVRPDDVRRVHQTALRPRGYTAEQAATLLAHAVQLDGCMRQSGIPRRLFIGSMVAVLWDTGVRCGDISRILVKNFDPSVSRLYVVESKTGKSGSLALRPATCELVAACIEATEPRELIWPGLLPLAIARTIRRTARGAGLPGGAKWIRRGSASEVERLHPGCGWRFLRHSDQSVFERFYHDITVSKAQDYLPPSIESDARAPANPSEKSNAFDPCATFEIVV